MFVFPSVLLIFTFINAVILISVETVPKESLATVERPVASTRYLNTVTATHSIGQGNYSTTLQHIIHPDIQPF